MFIQFGALTPHRKNPTHYKMLQRTSRYWTFGLHKSANFLDYMSGFELQKWFYDPLFDVTFCHVIKRNFYRHITDGYMTPTDTSLRTEPAKHLSGKATHFPSRDVEANYNLWQNLLTTTSKLDFHFLHASRGDEVTVNCTLSLLLQSRMKRTLFATFIPIVS